MYVSMTSKIKCYFSKFLDIDLYNENSTFIINMGRIALLTVILYSFAYRRCHNIPILLSVPFISCQSYCSCHHGVSLVQKLTSLPWYISLILEYQSGNVQVLIFCWLFPLVAEIDTAIIEVIIPNYSRNNTQKMVSVIIDSIFTKGNCIVKYDWKKHFRFFCFVRSFFSDIAGASKFLNYFNNKQKFHPQKTKSLKKNGNKCSDSVAIHATCLIRAKKV